MFETLGSILKVDKKYKLFLIIAVIIGVFLGVSEILFIYSLKEILVYFTLIETTSSFKLNFVNPIYLFLFFSLLRLVISALSYFWQIYLGSYFKFLVKKNVTSFLYSETQSFKISLKETGDLLSNISDKGAYCFQHYASFLALLFLIVVNLLFLLKINLELFFFSFSFLIILGLPFYLFSSKLSKYSEIFKISNSEYIKKIFLDARNILFLKISGSLKKNFFSQSKLNHDALNSQKLYSIKFSFISQVPFFLGVLIFFIIIYMSSQFVIIEKGDLLIFIFLFFRVCLSLGTLINAHGLIKFHYPFLIEYKNIIKIQKEQKEIVNGNIKISPKKLNSIDLVIQRGDLNKRIPNISLKEGEILSILGESGTGKSTLIFSLFKVIGKKSGKILWNDTEIDEIDIDHFYKKISFCGTDPFLIKGSLKENLYYGLSEDNENYESLDKLINICDAGFLNEINDSQKILEDEGINFSSGQRQKIALIRALIKKPKILILDEATSNIDLISEKKIIENIFKEYPKIIIIATSHRPGILIAKNKIQLN